MKCSITFELDERVLADNSAGILDSTVKELTNAFYAWRRKAQCDVLGHTTTDHNGRCLRCLEPVGSSELRSEDISHK